MFVFVNDEYKYELFEIKVWTVVIKNKYNIIWMNKAIKCSSKKTNDSCVCRVPIAFSCEEIYEGISIASMHSRSIVICHYWEACGTQDYAYYSL